MNSVCLVRPVAESGILELIHAMNQVVDLEEVIYEDDFTRALQDHDSGGASTRVCEVEHPAPRTNLESENSSLW